MDPLPQASRACPPAIEHLYEVVNMSTSSTEIILIFSVDLQLWHYFELYEGLIQGKQQENIFITYALVC